MSSTGRDDVLERPSNCYRARWHKDLRGDCRGCGVQARIRVVWDVVGSWPVVTGYCEDCAVGLGLEWKEDKSWSS